MTRKLSFFLVICILSTLIQKTQTICFAAAAPAKNQLYSKSCALMDGDSGRVLYGKDEELPLANASTTKILTCILTLETAELESVVTASSCAASQPKVHLGMTAGEQFYLKDLLYALMLESYNDCAVAIAEHVCGSVEQFSELMNAKAKRLGCKDTDFLTPNGLDAAKDGRFHHTTARDLCRIMKYCVWESPQKDVFLTITQCANHTFTNLKGKSYSLTNRNAFLHMMDGVLSGKTGFTGSAGYCYVAALESGGRKFCIALLGCGWPNNKTYKWSDAKKLFSYGMETFARKDLYAIAQPPELPDFRVRGGMSRRPCLKEYGADRILKPRAVMPEKAELWVLLCEPDEVYYEWDMKTACDAPVKKGTQIGTVTLKLNGQTVGEYPVVTEENVEKWSFRTFVSLFFRELFLLG